MKGRIGVVLVVLMMGTGCDEKLSDLAGPSPTLQPTFSSIQAEIFEKTDSAGRVACIQCHTNIGRNPPNGLNLTHDFAYANLVNVAVVGKAGATRVIPNDPENSYIIHKLEGRPGIAGQRMPRTGGPYLTEGQLLIIKRWITEGAENN